jgi:glyoxylase-like metal-dependent hydrolase (beta-lactamase superfamily II)
MDTYAYLIEGRERAMLIDNHVRLRQSARFLPGADGQPLILVNTHGHGDHAGGNYDFDECYIHPADIDMLYGQMVGYPKGVQEHKLEAAKKVAYPEYQDMFQLSDFSAPKPMITHPIYDGDVFDLGGRRSR